MVIRYTLIALLFTILSATGSFAQSPKDSVATDRAKAIAFAEANRYLDAYPILDRIAPALPNDVDVWTHYGISLASRSATLADPVQRKFERKRAFDALLKAKNLGTKNVIALSYLDQLPPDGGDDDNFSAASPEVEKALREGEQFFGKGEYDRAFASYEKASKLDPKNYEAVLFMGDSLYAQNKYAQSEAWFAKAAAIDPNRELAYRFWGDALMAQDKVKEATDKFIEAFVADPYGRQTWENINKLTRKQGKQFDVKGIFPPGTEGFGGITIDPAQLTDKDGTKFWLKYSETRDAWRKRQTPTSYRHSLKEELAALTAVADAAGSAIKSGQLKEPHHSLKNLVDFRDKNILEPYILFFLADEGIAEDYPEYRGANREKLRQFLINQVFVF